MCSILLGNALFLPSFSLSLSLFSPLSSFVFFFLVYPLRSICCSPFSFVLLLPFVPLPISPTTCYLCASDCNPLFCSISLSPFGLIASFDFPGFLSPCFVATTDSLPAHSTPLFFVLRPDPRLSTNRTIVQEAVQWLDCGGVLRGAIPAQTGTCPWRCSGRCVAAAVWQGSEEPDQLLLIKSQLWFLSGEPFSNGIRREAPRTCSFPPMTPTHLPGLSCTLPPPGPDEAESCSLLSLSEEACEEQATAAFGGSPGI